MDHYVTCVRIFASCQLGSSGQSPPLRPPSAPTKLKGPCRQQVSPVRRARSRRPFLHRGCCDDAVASPTEWARCQGDLL